VGRVDREGRTVVSTREVRLSIARGTGMPCPKRGCTRGKRPGSFCTQTEAKLLMNSEAQRGAAASTA